MSKYPIFNKTSSTTEATFEMEKIKNLTHIANELAEANRLRRVTIDLELMKEIDRAQIATFDFKDEDLA